jgi:phosphoglycerol transferase MdoB-like AlkP superfamily enzyme
VRFFFLGGLGRTGVSALVLLAIGVLVTLGVLDRMRCLVGLICDSFCHFPFLSFLYIFGSVIGEDRFEASHPSLFPFPFALFPSVSLYLAFGFRTECKLEDSIYLGRIWCWGWEKLQNCGMIPVEASV